MMTDNYLQKNLGFGITRGKVRKFLLSPIAIGLPPVCLWFWAEWQVDFDSLQLTCSMRVERRVACI
jgi:hypothetical protein